MYKAIYYNRPDNTIHLWDDGNGYSTFPYEKYAYVIDDKGSNTTLTGLKVKKVKSWSKEAEKQGLVFEHDVPVCSRILIDRYYDSDDPSKNNVVLYFDIEVEKGLKYSLPKDADNVITSIAYFDDKSKQYHCLLLDREGNLEDSKRDIKITGTDKTIPVQVKVHPTEEKLLQDFIIRWHRIAPNIVTGWNSQNFDIPYLYNRIKNVLGINWANKLSPIEIVEKREYGRDSFLQFAGIAQMDYMLLYKKFTYNEESSYKLDFIAKKELKRGKLEYEGSLDDLYKNDVDKFIEYNVNDVELLVSLNSKLDFIEIARGICHKGHVPYDDYQQSSRYLDGAIQTRCKRKGIVTIAKFGVSGEKAAGAFVKPPVVGKHNWIYSVDAQSLYPSLIITQNISLETQIGLVKNWQDIQLLTKLKDHDSLNEVCNFGYLDDDIIIEVNPIIHELFSDRCPETLKLNKQQFIDYLGEYDGTISSAGVIFTTKQKGIVPEILEEWFDERITYKNKLKDFVYGSSEYIYYDRKQLITKILLNSLYGVLLLPSFRYYSKLSGESVTLSGQSLIKFTDFIVNLYYKTKLGDKYKTNCVIYQDSDSVAGESLIKLESGDYERLDQLFLDHSLYNHYIDPQGKEFTFPSYCKFPYYDEINKDIKYGLVKYIEKHIVKKRRFKIKTKSGKEIIVSQDHSLMISDEYGNVSKRLTCDVNLGDKIIVF